MHIVLGVLTAAAAVYFFLIRARNTVHVGREVADMASDVMAAARRFGFRRKSNMHPVESMDDPKLGVAALSMAFLRLEELPSNDQLNNLLLILQSELDTDKDVANEMMVLGGWLAEQCKTPQAAITRLSRRVAKIGEPGTYDRLVSVLSRCKELEKSDLSERQLEALDDIKRAFRVA